MSKITNFFNVKSKSDVTEKESDATTKAEKRKHSSTSSVESLTSPIRQVCKKSTVETSEINDQMEVREILESIDARLRDMATKTDIDALAKQFQEKIETLEGKFF